VTRHSREKDAAEKGGKSLCWGKRAGIEEDCPTRSNTKPLHTNLAKKAPFQAREKPRLWREGKKTTRLMPREFELTTDGAPLASHHFGGGRSSLAGINREKSEEGDGKISGQRMRHHAWSSR